MGKYFVTIANRRAYYKVCRDDINKVFSCKIKKIPKIPNFLAFQKTSEDDAITIDQEEDAQFEPIQFFPTAT